MHIWTAEFLSTFWQADFPAILAALLLVVLSVLREEFASKKKAMISLFCFRPFPEVTLLERPRWRGAVMSFKKGEKKGKKRSELVNYFPRNSNA